MKKLILYTTLPLVHLEEFSIKKVSVRPSADGLKENYREQHFLFRKFVFSILPAILRDTRIDKFPFKYTTVTILLLISNCMSAANDTTITPFNNQFFDGYNQERMKDVVFPISSKNNYNKVVIHYTITCPPTGCDEYDRLVSINVVKKLPNNQMETIEIARLITAGEKECSLEMDVSDYLSLLSGNTTLHHYVSTQNTEGKGLFATLSFTFSKNTTKEWVAYNIKNINNNNPYQRWSASTYYNTLEQNTPTKFLSIPNDVEKAVIKITVSGHGIYDYANIKTPYLLQYLVIDYQHFFLDSLPVSRCQQGYCTEDTKGGVGWCPGTPVYIWELDVTHLLKNKNNIAINYNLEAKEQFNNLWYMLQSQLIFYKQNNNK